MKIPSEIHQRLKAQKDSKNKFLYQIIDQALKSHTYLVERRRAVQSTALALDPVLGGIDEGVVGK